MLNHRTLRIITIVLTLTTLVCSTSTLGREQKEEESRGFFFPDKTPDTYLQVPEIIRRHGYPAESHFVTTDDGYILQLHRIPHGKNRQADPSKRPVYLQHGLLTASADWIIAGPEISLAYLLADEGYDVWLGNIRGNTYSRSHVEYFPNEYRFWDFSFHEMAIYDAPASIDFILEKTNHTKLSYVGHSMGCTIFFVMCSERPEYNEKTLVHMGLAPVAYFSHTTSPARILAPFAAELAAIYNIFGHGAILTHSPVLNALLKVICTLNNLEIIFCENLVFLIFGRDMEQLKKNIVPVFLGQDPAGASTKTLVHFGQLINTGTFRQYDYGLLNEEVYKSPTPPDYNISAITAKIALFYGPNDPLANTIDVMKFYPQLPNPVGLFKVNYSDFTHLDFLWAKDARPLLYNHVVEIMDSFNEEENATL